MLSSKDALSVISGARVKRAHTSNGSIRGSHDATRGLKNATSTFVLAEPSLTVFVSSLLSSPRTTTATSFMPRAIKGASRFPGSQKVSAILGRETWIDVSSLDLSYISRSVESSSSAVTISLDTFSSVFSMNSSAIKGMRS